MGNLKSAVQILYRIWHTKICVKEKIKLSSYNETIIFHKLCFSFLAQGLLSFLVDVLDFFLNIPFR